MKKKQPWMLKGAIVLAIGEKATITKMQENKLDGVDYVYYIYCKVEGEKRASPYHPNDVAELIPQKETMKLDFSGNNLPPWGAAL